MSFEGGGRAVKGDDPVVVRVRKLMDKAAATANPHESDAFARKAAELVARHRIDPDRLRETRPNEDLIVREIALGRGAYVRGRLALLMAVAEVHDAKVVFGSTPTGTVAYVAGFDTDLDVVEVMYHSLHGQASTQMAAQRRATAAATQRFRRSFLFGYADRLGQLLATTRQTVERTARSRRFADRDQMALALVERSRRIDEFAASAFGRVRTARTPGAAQATGWAAGVAAANRADVGRARLAGRRALGRG